MCGITGFIGRGDQGVVKKMADTLHHRGPDEEGFFVDEENSVHFGFRRLAIIDLKGGSQPIFNEDSSVATVFNGEIYNFKGLREELKKRHTFKTNTDTEVIVHLYEEMGERCFEKFNGMFAIAIWDKKNRRLVLARDRMGKKPLYWARFGDTFLFGSEPKALLCHPAAQKRLNRAATLKYLFFLAVPSPHTIYDGIFKLEPGQMLVYEPGKDAQLQPYWCPRYETDSAITLGDALYELDRLLEDATRIRLVADVPVGVFLSGGIDSSTVAYYAARAAKERIQTYSIGFSDAGGVTGFDESAYAKKMSEHIGSHHHLEMFRPETLLNLIPEVSGFLDEPLADAAVLPTYLLSRFTKKHVTVALGGDGGDELFLGYPTFQAHRVAEWYRRLPNFVQKRVAPRLAQLLPVRHGALSFDYKVKAFLAGASYPVGIRQQVWISGASEEHFAHLFTPDFAAGLPKNTYHADIDEKLDGLQPKSVDEAAAFLYERYFLGDQVLTKVDRASMAASLEARAPFLDYRIVEFAHRIPFSLRLRFWKNKYVLKQLMRGKLPAEILDRPKKGFWVPIGPWLKKELAPLLGEYLGEERMRRQGIFEPAYISRLIREHQENRYDHRRLLWSLLMFQLWHERLMR